MPRIAAVATAVPQHVLEQSKARAFVSRIFPKDLLERLLPVFENANIDRRYLAVDADWLAGDHSFTETNDIYIGTALDLSERVLCDATAQLGIGTEDIHAIFFISTTGLSTPSIDARLFNRVPLSPHIKRIPVWGLGCAGGAAGLARAAEYLRSFPRERAIVISVELCSLAFQRRDLTKSNVIATALFGDGAAACILEGDEVPERDTTMGQPRIVDSLSTIYPDSLDVMGWRITSDGFSVVLSRDIPSIIQNLVKPNISELATRVGIKLEQIKHFIAHPGGAKVIGAFETALHATGEQFAISKEILRHYGNMSSATVYFILKCFLERVRKRSGEYGLLSALGPGFSSELVLLQW